MSTPPQQPIQPAAAPTPPVEEKNPIGTWGLALSIIGFLTCGILSPVGLVVSLIGLTKNPKTNAIIGAVLGGIGLMMMPVLGIMVAIAVPSFIRAREISRRNACQENLSKVDGATQQWALENNAAEDETPTWSDLVGEDSYLRRSPVCPGGGTYTLNEVGEHPNCSLSTQSPFPHDFPGLSNANY